MDFDSILLAKQLSGGGGSSVDVEALSVTENGTYTAQEGKAYSPVTVNVQVGNGYGGDGTWSRPMDLPKLDDMDISGGDVVYMTYLADEDLGFCDIYITMSSGIILVEVGNIQNGSFVAESTEAFNANKTYQKYFGSSNGGYKVIKISGKITNLNPRRNNWVSYNGNYRFSSYQGLVEIYGNLPHLTSYSSYGAGWLKAVHLGNIVPTSLASAFYNNYYLESADTQNWDLSNCTALNYAFASTYELRKVNASGWDVSSVTTCQAMFQNSGICEVDMSSWDMSLVTNTSLMFSNTRFVETTMPSSLAKYGANMFSGSDNQHLVYHIKATTPPTMDNTNAFNNIRSQAKIYVPSGTLSNYSSATNWSSYASYMEEE